MNNSDVAVNWALRKQAQGSHFYSDGEKLWSYGTCIGQHLDDGTIIVSNSRYSNSTSKHQNYMWSALNRAGLNRKVIVNPSVYLGRFIKDLRVFDGDSYMTHEYIKEQIEKYRRARKPETMERYICNARNKLEDMYAFAQRFNIPYNPPNFFNT